MSEIATMSFEDAMKELEQVVARLESGNTSLEESIKLYEQGAALRQHCESRLREAEERVEKITLSQGKPAGTTRVEDQL